MLYRANSFNLCTFLIFFHIPGSLCTQGREQYSHILKSSHDHTIVEHAGLGDCNHIWAPWGWSIPATPGRRRAGGISYERTINKDQILLYIHMSKYWTTDSRLCYPRVLNLTGLLHSLRVQPLTQVLRACEGL